MSSRRESSKKQHKGAWTVVFWVSLFLFLAILGVIGYILYGYWSADRGYEKIAETAFPITQDKLDGYSNENADKEYELADLVVDWDYLRSINSDIVAWVFMPGTRINYPVVQGTTNDEYLHRDFTYQEGFTARGGAIFLDASNAADFSDDASYIYGHHMNDGSMFACLSLQLEDQAEFNAHRYVYILTPDYNYKCKTFSLILPTGTENIVRTAFSDPEDKRGYFSGIIARSIVVPDEGFPDSGDIGKVFTLATCDYNQANGRAMLYSQVVSQDVPNNANQEKIVSENETTSQIHLK